MLSKRWEVMFFLFTGATIAYVLRVNMSVCAPEMKDELGWTETQKGLTLSAFFWGYSVGQVPASLVAEKLGSKTTFGFAILAPSILTLLVPLAANISFNTLLAIRALIGLAAAATFPSIYHFYPRWVPAAEKTKMISFSHSGMYVGEVLGFALAGALVERNFKLGDGNNVHGYSTVFYISGVMGILWFPFFFWRVYDTPEEHPSISPEEVLLIREGVYSSLDSDDNNENDDLGNPLVTQDSGSICTSTASDAESRLRRRSKSSSFSRAMAEGLTGPNLEGGISQNSLPEDHSDSSRHDNSSGKRSRASKFNYDEIPWGEIFSNPVALTLFLNMFTYGWIGYMVLTELPSYLTDVLGYDLEDAGFLSVVPYVANFFSVMVFGWLFDYVQVERGWQVRQVRQWAQRTALFGASGFLVLAGFMTMPGLAFACMVAALWFFGAIQCGISCAYLEAAPRFSTIMNTIGNMMGAIAGLIVPLVVSIFTNTFEAKAGWRITFFFTGALSCLALLCWRIFITSELVPALNTPKTRNVSSALDKESDTKNAFLQASN